MARRFSDEELKAMRNKGAMKVPLAFPAKKPEVSKDPSVRALQEIGKSLHDSIQAQGEKDTAIRQEMQAILKAVMGAIERIENKEISVDIKDKRPRKWKHTISYGANEKIKAIISEVMD